jgi:hypothetical protein
MNSPAGDWLLTIIVVLFPIVGVTEAGLFEKMDVAAGIALAASAILVTLAAIVRSRRGARLRDTLFLSTTSGVLAVVIGAPLAILVSEGGWPDFIQVEYHRMVAPFWVGLAGMAIAVAFAFVNLAFLGHYAVRTMDS